jgi:hypothetical protein
MPGRAPAGSFTITHHRGALVLALVAAGVTGLAACGSSTGITSPATTGTSSQLTAAQCIRAHGVPNFPDPGQNGGFQTILLSGGAVKINGITFSGPGFMAAEKICKPGGASTGNPAVPEQRQHAMLDFARCMRQHGISQYTDPQFPPSGGIFGGGVSPQAATAPAYKRAAAICAKAPVS